jgi:plasmid stability protein
MEERPMAQVLVRELKPEVVTRLKDRARSRGRSLQAELKDILEQASRQGTLDARSVALRIRRRLAGRRHSDSVDLVALDRAR